MGAWRTALVAAAVVWSASLASPASPGGGAADRGPVFFPQLPAGGRPAAPEPAPPPDPGVASRVLEGLPVYPGARLIFFEAPAGDPRADAVATYLLPETSRTQVEAWYRDRLPSYGWQPVPGRQGRWERYRRSLSLALVGTADGGPRLVARTEVLAARPATAALEAGLPLPPGTIRRRYDPDDQLAEEVVFDGGLAEAAAAMSSTLAAAGWLPGEGRALGPVRLRRFERADLRLVVGVWPDGGGATEIGLGDARCLPAELGPPPSSVYLAAAPGPAGASLLAFERGLEDRQLMETWRTACMDLDAAAALQVDTFGAAGWRGDVPPRRSSRWVAIDFAAPDGAPAVTVEIVPAEGGFAHIRLRRDEAGLATTDGRSLLYPDLPLPAPAVAMSLASDVAGGWRHRETYVVPTSLASIVQRWYEVNMPDFGWQYEGLEPPAEGPDQVFYGGGEEVVIRAAGDPPTVSLSRRRSCPDGVPRLADGQPQEARRLLEVPVPPGSRYQGFDAGTEAYGLECAGLGLLADWYREGMEAGNWALAATEMPSERERELLFVRPDELGLPHDQRTAWAAVSLHRRWPYRFQIRLARDPAGVKPPGP